eukprot:7191573-Prymnesium_polylepis.1
MGPSTWAGLSGYCLIVIVIVCRACAAPAPHTSHPSQLIAAQSESKESGMRPLMKTSSSALGRSIHA